MGRTKKLKVTIEGVSVSADDICRLYDMANVYTLAALKEREAGHMAVHERLLNDALSIKKQIGEQV